MKTVVITGVSSGIGKDLANLLITKGYKVYGLSRHKVEMQGLESLICDVQNLDQIKSCVNLIKEKENSIDVLINNAGIGIAGSILDSEYQDIQNLFATNLFGPIMVTKEFLPILVSGGKIINVGSVAGDLTIPYQGYYSMSKSALDKFSECLKMELKKDKVRVTTILPGDTKTGFTDNRKTVIKENTNAEIAKKSISKMEKDEQNGASPRKVSKVIYKVIKRKHPPMRVAVGFTYKLFIFLQRILPRKLVVKIVGSLYS